MSGLSPQKVHELKLFLEQVKKDPQILYVQELDFFREFLLHFGAHLPEKKVPQQTQSHTHGMHTEEKHEHEEHIHEPVHEEPVHEEKDEMEIDDPDLLTLEEGTPVEMGDEAITVTEEMRERASQTRSQGSMAESEGNFAEALIFYTDAVKLNPSSGIIYATRASLSLKMKRPRAAIADCDKAISINKDSAKPYKVRGRALRYTGKYEDALRDIQLGQKLDWDDSTHQFEAELKKLVIKVQEKRKSKEEKKTETTRKEA